MLSKSDSFISWACGKHERTPHLILPELSACQSMGT